jgi:hypothetical protein
VCANGDDVTDTFVATDEGELVSKWPVALAGVQVRVAHSGALHLDEALSWGELVWLLHRMVIPDRDG